MHKGIGLLKLVLTTMNNFQSYVIHRNRQTLASTETGRKNYNFDEMIFYVFYCFVVDCLLFYSLFFFHAAHSDADGPGCSEF